MKKIFVIFVVFVGVVVGGVYYARKTLVKKASNYLLDSVLETKLYNQAAKYGISKEQVQEVLNSVSEEDKQKVQEIVENHVTLDNISSLISTDKQEMVQKAKDMITASEKSELEALYNKYSYLIKK